MPETHHDLGAEATRYATQGARVFPLWWIDGDACACGAGARCGAPGKHPRVGGGGVHLATTDPRQITTWWQAWPDANIGLPAGANGLGIIDVDPKDHGDTALTKLCDWALTHHGTDLMATRVIRTGSGGWHLYYQAPPDGVKNAARTLGVPGIDTRGRGGYVVAPPSLHISGRRYTVENDTEPAPWPALLTHLIDYRPHTPAPAPALAAGAGTPVPASRAAAYGQAALTGTITELAALQPGDGRNNALNTAAYRLGRMIAGGMLNRGDVTDALYNTAIRWGAHHTDRSIRATIASGLTGGMAHPHPGPTTGGTP